MAHQCLDCGAKCNCSGDVDDLIINDPDRCRGCGCMEDDESDDWEVIGYECVGCGLDFDKPGICPVCNNPLEPYY